MSDSATTPSTTSAPFTPFRRRRPVGAELSGSSTAHVRVWAPRSQRVAIYASGEDEALQKAAEIELIAEADGYWSGLVKEARAGMHYRYRLDSGAFPGSRFALSAQGPHGPSEIIDPAAFDWTDRGWPGVREAGHLRDARRHLHARRDVGAAPRELCRTGAPRHDVAGNHAHRGFPGAFGWGYDGVNLFAPTRLYGAPTISGASSIAPMRSASASSSTSSTTISVRTAIICANFAAGLFHRTLPERVGRRRSTSTATIPRPVREFFSRTPATGSTSFISTVCDSTRRNKSSTVDDTSSPTIGRGARCGRARVGSSSSRKTSRRTRLVRPVEEGGYGLDALWNDDFHHSAMVALTGRAEAYYTDTRGEAQEFVSAAKFGFCFRGSRTLAARTAAARRRDVPPPRSSSFRRTTTRSRIPRAAMRGHQLTSPGRWRAMTALLLLMPSTPMLFQGQEFAASTPFLYFADSNATCRRLRQGRGNSCRSFRACRDRRALPSPTPATRDFRALQARLPRAHRGPAWSTTCTAIC